MMPVMLQNAVILPLCWGLRQVSEEGLPGGHTHAAQDCDEYSHQQGLDKRAAVDEAHNGPRGDDYGGYEEEVPPLLSEIRTNGNLTNARGGLHCRDEPPLGEGEVDHILRCVDDPEWMPDGSAKAEEGPHDPQYLRGPWESAQGLTNPREGVHSELPDPHFDWLRGGEGLLDIIVPDD